MTRKDRENLQAMLFSLLLGQGYKHIFNLVIQEEDSIKPSRRNRKGLSNIVSEISSDEFSNSIVKQDFEAYRGIKPNEKIGVYMYRDLVIRLSVKAIKKLYGDVAANLVAQLIEDGFDFNYLNFSQILTENLRLSISNN